MSARLTYEEAATRLGVSVRTVYRRAASGQLETVTDNGHTYVVMPEASDPAMPAPSLPPGDSQVSDAVSELRARLADLEAERNHWRSVADKLTDTVSELSANVSQLTQTVQGLEVMRAQSEGRMIAAETPPERPNDTTMVSTPPRRRRSLRDLYRAWRGR